jgi:uncharacterized protein
VEKAFYVPAVESHLIQSKYVDQTYKVEIMQPLMCRSADERFPVLYIVDGNDTFGAAQCISHSLQIAGQVRRYILVGIGYPGDNPFVGDILRGRDLTPLRRAPITGFPTESPVEGVPGIGNGKSWHGADDFLRFIRAELVPLVETRYPAQPGDRGYFGHSLGGGLGLHALFSQPALFTRFILSSPSISWDGDPHGLEPAERAARAGARIDAKVFLSVGGEEEFQPAYRKSEFCSSFFRLAALLQRANLPGLQIHRELIPGETHASVWPIAFMHGVQAVFGPADAPPLTY